MKLEIEKKEQYPFDYVEIIKEDGIYLLCIGGDIDYMNFNEITMVPSARFNIDEIHKKGICIKKGDITCNVFIDHYKQLYLSNSEEDFDLMIFVFREMQKPVVIDKFIPTEEK